MLHPTKEELFSILASVHDPETPAVNVVEMGIVRDVEFSGGAVHVTITPTYSGCPAMKVIEDDIVASLRSAGYENTFVATVSSPAWTTAWLSDSTKRKLKTYGIAPPQQIPEEVILLLPTIQETVPCPFCESSETEVRSDFGSTACKALHYCNNCRQPFEHLKEI